MAAPDYPGIHGGHDEWRRPALRVGVEADASLVTAVRPALFTLGVQAVRPGQNAGNVPVRSRFAHDIHDARHGSAARAALDGFDEQNDGLAICVVAFPCFLLQEPGANVHRYGIEATAVNDASTGLPRGRVMLVDHAPDPLHLPGEVAIMRAAFCAGRHEFAPVARIRSYRGQHYARALCDFTH